MKKKFLLMMMLSLLFTAMGTSVLNAQVAKVGDTEYATIDEAIANWTHKTTLTLLADVTLSDVIQLSSTEMHTLDLGTYTMTAASKKDAIQIVNNGCSSASYALDIKADATNPGGITATGKAVVKTTGKSGVKDRPIICFYGGVLTGSNVVSHSGSNGTNCPQFWFYGGEFNGTISANRAKFIFYGGTFNGNIWISVDSNADALVRGGKFKKLSNLYGSSLNTEKFTIGSAAGVYDRGIYVDKDGYYVVTSEVITKVSAKYPAVKTESYNSNNYFYYSAAAANGMFYEVASMAGTGSNVTVYEHAEVVEELDNNAAVNDYTPVLPSEVVTFEVEVIDIEATAEATTKVTFNVEPKDAGGNKVSNPSSAITFRLPVPASWEGKAKVYHENDLLGKYAIATENYVEVVSDNFSEFAVEQIVPLFEGEGTATSPYLIASVEKLVALRDEVNAGETYDDVYFELISDITLTGEWTPIGNGSRSSKTYTGNSFKGVFDGNNNIISGLTITSTTGDDVAIGLFGIVDRGTVKNLNLTDVNINVASSDLAGAAIGMMLNGATADKITVSGAIVGHDGVGGIVGRLIIDGTISNCINNASVTSAYGGIGGIVGKPYYEDGANTSTFAYITDCINNGTVTAPMYIGGIAGLARANFTGCTNNGAVVGGTQTGGIVGQLIAAGTVSGNENKAKISGKNHLGGIIGDYSQSSAFTYYNVSIANNINRGELAATEQCAAIMGCNNIDGFTAMTATGNVSYYYVEGLELFGNPEDMVIDETNKFIIPVAQVGEQTFYTFAEAVTAAQDGKTIQLLWAEGDAPISMAASLYGKNVTITGTATVDWSKGNLFVGRGGNINGEGNAILTFDNANLTSASDNASTGIHVSGREKNTDNKYDGTLVIKNGSNIQLDYLIDRGTITIDNATLTVKNGFGIAGRPATETEANKPATATISLENGARLIVNNHNGMGVGQAAKDPEGYGIMNINSGSTFETTQSFTVTAMGTMNVNGGNVETVGTLTNNGAVNVTGESILDIETLTENEIYFLDGAIIKNSTIGGEVFVAGKVTFCGNNTFAMLYDFGTLTDNYGTTANMEWTVEEGASLTLTKKARYGLGYGDNVTINGSITNALVARENLTEDDRSLFMHGLVAQESSGFNCNSKLTVNNAYVVLGSNNSFGNKPGNYGGNYTFNFNNSVVDGSRITFYEASSITEFTFEDSDVKIGTFMTRDTDSKFTLKNSKVLSTAINNGNDEGNYNAGELTLLDKSSLTYSVAFTNTGTLNLDLSSMLTAPSVAGNGTINIDATDFEGNEICVISANMASFEGVINVEGAHYMKKYNGIYVTGAQGTLTKAYTSATGYWGECGGNANESFVLRFYNDNTYMGQTSLNDIDNNIIDGDVYVTWSIDLNIDPNAEGYWAMSWDIRPTLAMQPNRVEQWIDGEKVAECAVEPNWADNIFPVVAAVTDENDVILSYVNNTTGATLNDAFAAGGNIAILRDFNLAESVTVPADKTVVLDLNGKTITGTPAEAKAFAVITNKGNLTITDGTETEGKIVCDHKLAGSTEYAVNTITNSGTLTIAAGTIQNTSTASNQIGYAIDNNSTTGNTILVIEGGKVTASGSNYYDGIRQFCNSETLENNVTIEGGEVSSLWLQNPSDGSGGTQNTKDFKGSFAINGGTLNNLYLEPSTQFAGAITGGHVGNISRFQTAEGRDLEGFITGGTFSVDPTAYCAPDYSPIFNGSTYTVIKTSGTFTRTLSSGWSWFSYYIDIEGSTGLDALKEDMGAACEQFKSQTAFTFYSNNKWYIGPNALTGTNVEDMYMVKMRESKEISLSGKLAVPEEEKITLKENGWTWIGYPLENSINVSDALATFNSIEGDYIKSKTLYAEYVKLSNGTYAWKGSLNSMIPGEGYKYKSVSGEEKEVYYSSASNRTAVKANVTSENNYWVASNSKYSSNMTVVAMMSIDNEIVNDSYEIAAFANGECRGSARAIYDEDLNAYMLYLTIHGEDVENITFKYYDVNYGTEYELGNVVVYSSDAILGSINNPYMFNLDILNVDEASINEVNVYPNPTTTNAEIDLNATCDKVEVFNALGVKVAEYSNVDSIDALETAGVYVIRVTIDGNVRNCRLVVK